MRVLAVLLLGAALSLGCSKKPTLRTESVAPIMKSTATTVPARTEPATVAVPEPESEPAPPAEQEMPRSGCH
jgi:hypothetical protein